MLFDIANKQDANLLHNFGYDKGTVVFLNHAPVG